MSASSGDPVQENLMERNTHAWTLYIFVCVFLYKTRSISLTSSWTPLRLAIKHPRTLINSCKDLRTHCVLEVLEQLEDLTHSRDHLIYAICLFHNICFWLEILRYSKLFSFSSTGSFAPCALFWMCAIKAEPSASLQQSSLCS